ncbi:hypothetical protein E2C01_023901 [Portunus trituberculatus]|uniref:Uncharacterized protein n=1 Tax=Portunus trituberculatus TaxID=210409 RepID=A0A5B7ECF5_PORTR|nr:hypothetical protein [Portunus trituberculatus]
MKSSENQQSEVVVVVSVGTGSVRLMARGRGREQLSVCLRGKGMERRVWLGLVDLVLQWSTGVVLRGMVQWVVVVVVNGRKERWGNTQERRHKTGTHGTVSGHAILVLSVRSDVESKVWWMKVSDMGERGPCKAAPQPSLTLASDTNSSNDHNSATNTTVQVGKHVKN